MLNIRNVIKKNFLFGNFNSSLDFKTKPHYDRLISICRIETVVALIPSYKKKSYISGLMTKSFEEKNLYFEDSILGKEYRMYDKTIYAKVMLNFSCNEETTQAKIFLKAYNAVFGFSDKIPKTKDLNNIISGKKEITLIQHHISAFFGNKTYSYNVLEDFAGTQIDCSSYKDYAISIQTFTEVAILKKVLFNNNIEMPYIKIFLINTQNLSSLPFFYNPVECYLALKQKNCDAVIVKIHPSTGKYILKYIDIKTHGLFAVGNDHISLCNENLKDVLKEINDFKISFSKKMQELNDINHPLIRFWNDFLNPIYLLPKDKANAFEKYNLLIKKVKSIIIENNFDSLNIGLSVSTGKDLFFNDFYHNVLKPFLKRYDDRSMVGLFPSDCILDDDNRRIILLDFLENYLSEETRSLVENSLSILEITY